MDRGELTDAAWEITGPCSRLNGAGRRNRRTASAKSCGSVRGDL